MQRGNRAFGVPELKRCSWVPEGNTLYEEYHDHEWGRPVHDDKVHFEFLILEGAQAGLSWETILKRRSGYAKAFHNFDWKKVAQFDEKKIEELMQDSQIIRNRKKIESSILNAKGFAKIISEFGSFDRYVWGFVKGKTICNRPKSKNDLLCESVESRALSKDLLKRGFKFVGPTIIYSYMQAVGLVNDHFADCFVLSERA